MKKKLLGLMLVVCLLIPCLMFVGCGKDKTDETNFVTLTKLERNQTLNIGNYAKFKNYAEARVEPYYLTYTAAATATLNRTTYSYSSTAVYYNGYYYSWSISIRKENVLLGHKTTEENITYSYLSYGNDNSNILVKSRKETKTRYDFQQRKFEKPCEITYELGGYFESVNEIKDNVADLYQRLKEQLVVSETNTYFIENPKTVCEFDEETYTNTYFYFS